MQWILYEVDLGDETHRRRGAVPAESTHIRQARGQADPSDEYDIWPAALDESSANMRTVHIVKFTDAIESVANWLATSGDKLEE